MLAHAAQNRADAEAAAAAPPAGVWLDTDKLTRQATAAEIEELGGGASEAKPAARTAAPGHAGASE